MPLNSVTFIAVFLPVVFLIYAALRKYAGGRRPELWLVVASLSFYGYSGLRQLPLLLGSIVFNWGIARLMVPRPGGPRRKWALPIGLVGNIAFLCVIKYADFFFGTLAALHGPRIAVTHGELPLGVSFFTLTQIMYLVDTHQELNDANSLFDHAALVSFFPYITAGPLVRSRETVPQFARFGFQESRNERACRGLYLFSLGLAKKVVLADSFARLVDAGFSTAGHVSTLAAWVFTLAYTFQIYFDFSGYSDMALGAAWIFGIDIPQNFNAPYRSQSITEFWRRWHISLSNFITDYLYTPILRSMGRATLATSAVATVIAMGIIGLWHGPAWTFVIFGLLHGAGLAANQIWRRRKLKMPGWLAWAATFIFLNVAFCWFRSPSVGYALQLLKSMLPQQDLFGAQALKGIVFRSEVFRMALAVFAAFAFKTSSELAASFRPTRAAAGVTAILLLLSWYFMDSSTTKQFIYRGF
jgi:alginate O-acetyltransferase complex protein AlgI